MVAAGLFGDGLSADAVGDASAPPMILVHPNPLDGSTWLFQTAEFSHRFRCVTIDLPGYGRSSAERSSFSMEQVADACWAAADRHADLDEVVLVGCSVGSNVVQHMYHRRPDAVRAVVLSGAGWRPVKFYADQRIAEFRAKGVAYREEYSRDVFAPAFRETPLARWISGLITERRSEADVETIIRTFEALRVPDPVWLARELVAPVLIIRGEHDSAFDAAAELHDRLPNSILTTLYGAGHACHIEEPWSFNQEITKFLAGLWRNDLKVYGR